MISKNEIRIANMEHYKKSGWASCYETDETFKDLTELDKHQEKTIIEVQHLRKIKCSEK